jgi:hypothetical protein
VSRRPLVLAAALVALTVLALGHVTGTMAAFTDTATVTAGQPDAANAAFTAGSIATPATPGAAQTAATSVTLTWTATPVGTGGGVASSYDVLRFPTVTGGTPVTVCTVSALSCVDTAPPSGTSYYQLRARVGTSWTKDSARVAYTPDTAAPKVVITVPLNSCSGTTTVACGTASDSATGSAGVTKVEYTLRRTRVGAFSGSTAHACWTGSGWASDTSGGCAYLTATGTTSWTVPGSRSTAYAQSLFYNDSFTLTARATDSLGNVSTPVSASYAT